MNPECKVFQLKISYATLAVSAVVELVIVVRMRALVCQSAAKTAQSGCVYQIPTFAVETNLMSLVNYGAFYREQVLFKRSNSSEPLFLDSNLH
jgi:hypothetical protein